MEVIRIGRKTFFPGITKGILQNKNSIPTIAFRLRRPVFQETIYIYIYQRQSAILIVRNTRARPVNFEENETDVTHEVVISSVPDPRVRQ